MRPAISVLAKGREFVVHADPTTGKYMFPQELIDVADRFWQVDGLYHAGFFQYVIDYFRVLAIGDEKVFGERYIVKPKASMWNWARQFVGLKPKFNKVVIEVYVVEQNKYYFGRSKVESIKEKSLSDNVQIDYSSQYESMKRNRDSRSIDYWVVGGTYKTSTPGNERTFEILAIHMNKLFVRFEDGSEGIREMGSWITRVK